MKILIIFCCILATSTSQISTQIVECCGNTLQDVNRNVALETSLQLSPAPATYSALIVRLCSQEPFYVQVWTQLGGQTSSYQLKWQLSVTPTANQTMYAPTVINFDKFPLTVSGSDRLGISMPYTRLNKLPVPYASSSDGSYIPSLTFSDPNFDASQPQTPGLVLSFPTAPLFRTFSPYLKFCATSLSCPMLTGNLNPPVPTSYLPYVSVPQSCCDKSVSCDSNNSLGSQLNNQMNLINSLTQTIIQLQLIVNSLLNSTVNTGWCPPGFVSGFYGIGFCYKAMFNKLQLAEAAVSCNSYERSRVVFILSALEDSFINNLIQSNQTADVGSSRVKFWTSALFNTANQNWYWYNYQLLRNEVFGNYRDWKNKDEPVPSRKDEVCATFTRDGLAADYYWEIANCSEPNFYICKLPKQCL